MLMPPTGTATVHPPASRIEKALWTCSHLLGEHGKAVQRASLVIGEPAGHRDHGGLPNVFCASSLMVSNDVQLKYPCTSL